MNFLTFSLGFLAGAFLLWRFPKLGDKTFEPVIRWIADKISNFRK